VTPKGPGTKECHRAAQTIPPPDPALRRPNRARHCRLGAGARRSTARCRCAGAARRVRAGVARLDVVPPQREWRSGDRVGHARRHRRLSLACCRAGRWYRALRTCARGLGARHLHTDRLRPVHRPVDSGGLPRGRDAVRLRLRLAPERARQCRPPRHIRRRAPGGGGAVRHRRPQHGRPHCPQLYRGRRRERARPAPRHRRHALARLGAGDGVPARRAWARKYRRGWHRNVSRSRAELPIDTRTAARAAATRRGSCRPSPTTGPR
jgi:hypothetical protein